LKLIPFLNPETNKTAYKCDCCDVVYNDLPLCFGSDYPEYYFSVPPEEREERIQLEESLCIIDDKYFFHRGRLTIPIIDHHEDFAFDIWTSISAENFEIRMNLWEDENRTKQEPYFGWLQTMVPNYGETLSLKTIAIEQELGFIPEIKCIEENHPLTIDQENGITFEKAKEMVENILRQSHNQ
jgi:hypothetical protein